LRAYKCAEHHPAECDNRGLYALSALPLLFEPIPKKILKQQPCSVSQELCSIEQQSNAGETPTTIVCRLPVNVQVLILFVIRKTLWRFLADIVFVFVESDKDHDGIDQDGGVGR
jgi:hypothetical protein